MRRSSAALGSAAFFVAAPGTVVGLGPWPITRWRLPDAATYPVAPMALGVVLIVVRLVPPVAAFTRLARAYRRAVSAWIPRVVHGRASRGTRPAITLLVRSRPGRWTHFAQLGAA